MPKDERHVGVNPVVVYSIVAVAAAAIVALVGLGVYLAVGRRAAQHPYGDGRPVDINMLTGQPVDSKARLTEENLKRARDAADFLSERVEYYKELKGHYPANIRVLTEEEKGKGGWYGIPDIHIIDPWGKVYQIDPSGKRNKGEKADIYTTTPDGEVIGNFPSP